MQSKWWEFTVRDVVSFRENFRGELFLYYQYEVKEGPEQCVFGVVNVAKKITAFGLCRMFGVDGVEVRRCSGYRRGVVDGGDEDRLKGEWVSGRRRRSRRELVGGTRAGEVGGMDRDMVGGRCLYRSGYSAVVLVERVRCKYLLVEEVCQLLVEFNEGFSEVVLYHFQPGWALYVRSNGECDSVSGRRQVEEFVRKRCMVWWQFVSVGSWRRMVEDGIDI